MLSVDTEVYEIPTDRHEADGTFAWDRTTMVLVHVKAKGEVGLGWTYAHGAAASLVTGPLAKAIHRMDPFDIPAAYAAMNHAVRNLGRPGLAWEAISAVDIALWDLKAKLLGVSIADLAGRARESVAAYGSGGFTSYDDRTLAEQLGHWAERGFRAVKMKVGTDPGRDLERVRIAREAIGPRVGLYVDANGGYDRKQALGFAEAFARYGVSWFEEPVSSEDVEGLHLVRDRAPAEMDIAAGEYGYVLPDFRRLIEHQCVDVLQADATRCGGITGFLAVGALAESFNLPFSAHCAPTIHGQAGCAVRGLRDLEYFHDHGRLEHMLFDGALSPHDGRLRPSRERPGLGVELRAAAREYRVQ